MNVLRLLSLSAAVVASTACSCAGTQSCKDTSVRFHGEVQKRSIDCGDESIKIYDIDVIKVFKNDLDDSLPLEDMGTVTVISNGATSCGANLEVGKTYLISSESSDYFLPSNESKGVDATGVDATGPRFIAASGDREDGGGFARGFVFSDGEGSANVDATSESTTFSSRKLQSSKIIRGNVDRVTETSVRARSQSISTSCRAKSVAPLITDACSIVEFPTVDELEAAKEDC